VCVCVCVCGDISCTWQSKCNVCFSTDVLGSPLKEISGQPPALPPALPPKRSRISSGRSATSPPPISPPPTSRLQQDLHPKLHHTSGDVDTGQTRFCICGFIWTPVRWGSVSVALVVTCGRQLDTVLYLWHWQSCVDTSQTRFYICGISCHMWTPVRQGSVSVALAVTCYSSVEPLSCCCMVTGHCKCDCHQQFSSTSCCPTQLSPDRSLTLCSSKQSFYCCPSLCLGTG
jgi:hypothetical protein